MRVCTSMGKFYACRGAKGTALKWNSELDEVWEKRFEYSQKEEW